jgi:hypothetical protein
MLVFFAQNALEKARCPVKFNEKYRWDIICCGSSIMEKASWSVRFNQEFR